MKKLDECKNNHVIIFRKLPSKVRVRARLLYGRPTVKHAYQSPLHANDVILRKGKNKGRSSLATVNRRLISTAK